MPSVPGTPNIPGGGERQRRAAELKAEMDRRTAEATKPQESQPEEPSQETQVGEQHDTSTGPVGDGDYVVKEGDCTSSIAKNTGHFWETVWNDPGNAELKRERKDPNVLLPGDRLTVPELRRKEEPGATEQRHRFRRKGEPAKLKLRVMKERQPVPVEEQQEGEQRAKPAARERSPEPREDEPRANLRYTLEIDGETFSGQTDEEGYLEHSIPGNARRGRVILEPGTVNETEMRLQLGHLSPISEIVGVKQRLNNLAFGCGEETDELTPGLEAALKAFQEKHGLEMTGRPDRATRDKVQEAHGS